MQSSAAQSSVLPSSHTELLTSLSLSYTGTLLATSSLDHTIRISALNPSTSASWQPLADFKAHDAPVLCTAWAHPEFGTLLASGGGDGMVNLWTESNSSSTSNGQLGNANSSGGKDQQKKWARTAALTDARGTIRGIEFSPPEFGLKLAAISSDSHLRVWECLDPVGRAEWQLLNDIDLLSVFTEGGGASGGTAVGGGSAGGGGAESSGSSSMGSGLGGVGLGGGGGGVRKGVESDGGWAVSWCKEAWWGERIAVAAGTSGVIRLFYLPSHSTPIQFLSLPTPRSSPSVPISSLSFAPPSGRSYQLLASGSRGSKARVWKIHTPSEDDDGVDVSGGKGEWKGEVEAELEEAGERVGWNLTGTVLSTSGGDDAKVRLWKTTYTGQWRTIATLKTEDEDSMDLGR